MKKDRFIAKKSLGQNFINDENFLQKLSSLIVTDNDSLIIEIGPGKGALTKELVKKKNSQIFVIEKDNELIDDLVRFSKVSKNFRIFHEDALKINYNKFIQENSIIVGNLPFNISSNLLMTWIFKLRAAH